jgi:hypothetical protein
MLFAHRELLESFTTTPPSHLFPINENINKRKSRQPRQSLSALRCTQDNTAQHYCNRRARAHQPQHARCRTGAERIPCAFLFLRCGTIFQNWMPVNRPRTYKCTHKCTHNACTNARKMCVGTFLFHYTTHPAWRLRWCCCGCPCV